MDAKARDQALQNFEKTSFYPSDILVECPKFRVLVAGQTGSGKSTLCSKIFRVSTEKGKENAADFGISHHSRGTEIPQVWKEITFPGQNEQIILHDSGGFEAGGTGELEEIKKFIKDRVKRTTLGEQLHCIWYCIDMSGNRQIQTAEKTFFNDFDLGDIPVVAVFTHFDEVKDRYQFKLEQQFRRANKGVPTPDQSDQAEAFAIRDYETIHRRNLEKLVGKHSRIGMQYVAMPTDDDMAFGSSSYSAGVDDLINQTKEMLAGEGLRRLWASAQQQDAELKMQETIKVAMKQFDKVVISSTVPLVPFVSGTAFSSAFNNIYSSANKAYGLMDPSEIMLRKSTRKRIYEACLNLSEWERRIHKFGLMINFLGGAIAHVITSALLKTVAGILLIHEELFWRQREQQGLLLTADAVDDVCTEFGNSKIRRNVAAHIDGSILLHNYGDRQYCTDTLVTALEARNRHKPPHRERT
ncbi:MAG: hypothetical protein Q9170_007079 [Blastenia crenularia]